MGKTLDETRRLFNSGCLYCGFVAPSEFEAAEDMHPTVRCQRGILGDVDQLTTFHV